MKKKKSKGHVRVVDLFAGIGGLRTGATKGFEKMGYTTEVVFTSEIKKTAIATLKLNHPDEKIHGDITQVPTEDIPDHDLLLAGFPCQAFSTAGRRQGFEDKTKGTLFFDVARILEAKKPRHFILENVEGLLMHDHDPTKPRGTYGRTFTIILETLTELGYSVDWALLNATDFGVPQARKRVFIVGSLKGQVDLNRVKKNPSRPLSAILEKGVVDSDPKIVRFNELLKEEYGDITALEGKIFRDWRGGERNLHSWNFNFKGRTSHYERELLELLVQQSKSYKWVPAGQRREGEGSALTPQQVASFVPGGEKKVTAALERLTTLGYLHEKPGGTYKVASGKLTMPVGHILRRDGYANTLVATDADRLTVVDGDKLRRLTRKEMRKLFGFPKGFQIAESMPDRVVFDLYGNSVVAPVAKAVAVALLKSK